MLGYVIGVIVVKLKEMLVLFSITHPHRTDRDIQETRSQAFYSLTHMLEIFRF